ncbi:NUDIX hydrolase [Alkalibacter mobilis]|uniref:NUDIX hydrolase n=1 Tax=Alkalibacter mobilis TaxID=2787712 RepID=UPI00189E6737|nr:NUDIX hydrolase [Alkalibacter mobilis]MBF7097137.1 NUDIX hydrolase [Alkalibacter mobilis]
MSYEKTLETKEIYKGKILDLDVEKVELQNGKISYREIVRHNGACAVLAVNNNKVVMIRQYRKPVDLDLLEIPAGKIDEGELPEACAVRELEEETGFIPRKLIKLGEIYTSPGFSNEIIYMYYSNELLVGKINRDEDEFIDVVEVEMESLDGMIKEGKIKDGKTLAAITMYRSLVLAND